MQRILIIDDDPKVRAALCLVLEDKGYEVSAAADGQAGMRMLNSSEFDLVIADIFMPGMDGLETVQALRQRLPNIPIIIMSGLLSGPIARFADTAVPNFLAVALRFGATIALRKPFKPDDLLRAIQACMASPEQIAPDRPPRTDDKSDKRTQWQATPG